MIFNRVGINVHKMEMMKIYYHIEESSRGIKEFRYLP